MAPFRQQLAASPLYPLFILDLFLGHRVRHRLLFLISLILAGLGLLLSTAWFLPLVLPPAGVWLLVQTAVAKIIGLGFILFAVWALVYLLETYFRYRYFSSTSVETLVSFDVGRCLYRLADADLVLGFLTSEVGRHWLGRLGVDEQSRTEFILARRAKSMSTPLFFEPGKTLTLPVLVERLFDGNPDLAKWLMSLSLGRPESVGAARWVEGSRRAVRDAERWWTRERLGRIPGLAKDWSYGESYLLNQYSLDLLTLPETEPVDLRRLWYRQAVEQMETILGRAREANAFLVGPAGAPLEVIYELTKLIRAGRSQPALEPKHPKLLRTAILLSRFKDRQGLEAELVRIFNEVIKSGNIILVIDDLPSFISAASALGANLEQLLDPYLASRQVQVVALGETDAYHRVIEPRAFLKERFEVVICSEPPTEAIETRFLALAEVLERRGRVNFTYPAILTLVALGERFAGSEPAADQAFDLLEEIAPWAAGQGFALIGQDQVLKFATEKLRVPLGAVGAVEKDRLLKLESLLHERVIGQDQAIVALANALRRNRAGLRDLKRPLGSFLFLGPTGVGKTETAKALADVFFGGEDRLLRLDMSEYRGPEALPRLVGRAESGAPGILAKLVRDEPYGVLLLDEFEKTEPEVLNLFLQILDEGFFSDMMGKRVNARNLMFIATSNAGAAEIWELLGAGRRLVEAEREIIDALIKQGIFKPELLNRFDAVIIFNPLAEDASRGVARLLLNRFAKRLLARGLALKVTDETVAAVARRGFDRQFGARPLARYIQDTMEQLVADRLLAGELKSGQGVEFKPQSVNGHDWSLSVT